MGSKQKQQKQQPQEQQQQRQQESSLLSNSCAHTKLRYALQAGSHSRALSDSLSLFENFGFLCFGFGFGVRVCFVRAHRLHINGGVDASLMSLLVPSWLWLAEQSNESNRAEPSPCSSSSRNRRRSDAMLWKVSTIFIYKRQVESKRNLNKL